ncbi:hypothetical protein ACFFWC_00025 [Plantactinospora siamensis]|uniref:DinB-like domain-containing protein n=1 Tax=Plantactinospora siamensis TaxID=555372 RepID=A0ABV6NTY9_9ACTN
MDTAVLRRGYELVLAEIEAGGFGPPPEGEWTAEQVVAHLAANDELLAEATEAVLAGAPYAYYNHNALHRPQLDGLVAECGGLAGLATLLRATSQRLCSLIDRLDAVAADVPVETHIRDGDRIVIDEPVPWGRVVDIHERVHLPAHTDQLRALRPAGGAPSA